MKQRLVIIPIDDLLELLKDYAGLTSIPDDAQADRLQIQPSDRKLALQLVAGSWDGPQPAEEIRFDLQRTFKVS